MSGTAVKLAAAGTVLFMGGEVVAESYANIPSAAVNIYNQVTTTGEVPEHYSEYDAGRDMASLALGALTLTGIAWGVAAVADRRRPVAPDSQPTDAHQEADQEVS